MGTELLLEFRKVSKVFLDSGPRPVIALEDVSFEIRRGEFVTLIGPSGCGKSTLLRLAAGLDTPSVGVALFEGQPIVGPDLKRGFVFQSYSAFPWLTVAQNIGFGIPKELVSIRSAEVSKWLRLMGLCDFANAFPRDLSGGMRQRLAIARSMIVKPTLLLMDEPFGALDPHTREAMQEILLEVVANSDCSILFVTHDLREATFLGDRIVLLDSRPGRVLEEFCSPLSKPRHREALSSAECLSHYERLFARFPIQSP